MIDISKSPKAMDSNYFMQLAIEEAKLASSLDEVPVGAVIVKNGEVIARGHNKPIGAHDPSAHAEICAIRQSALIQKNYRLVDCELYVTLEPCLMCCGAILHARIKRVIFGAKDEKIGAAGSVLNVFEIPALNHQTTVEGGVLKEECAQLLQDFFKAKRLAKKI